MLFLQFTLREKIKTRLLEFRELVKEIINTACHGALLVVGYTYDDSNLKVPDHIVGKFFLLYFVYF